MASPLAVKLIYYVISIESEDANMGIRKSILTTLAITLIGTAPVWSQSLLKTLDPDNDGTVDLTEECSFQAVRQA